MYKEDLVLNYKGWFAIKPNQCIGTCVNLYISTYLYIYIYIYIYIYVYIIGWKLCELLFALAYTKKFTRFILLQLFFFNFNFLIIFLAGNCEKFVKWCKNCAQISVWLWDWWSPYYGKWPVFSCKYFGYSDAGRYAYQQVLWGELSFHFSIEICIYFYHRILHVSLVWQETEFSDEAPESVQWCFHCIYSLNHSDLE